jgi:hypothetical protein
VTFQPCPGDLRCQMTLVTPPPGHFQAPRTLVLSRLLRESVAVDRGKPMRFSRLHLNLTFSVLIFSMLCASSAFATSITMTYEGHQGAVSQNGSPYVGYPFYVSMNGSSTYTPLLCDAFDNEMAVGQTWTATASPFLQGIAHSMFGSSMILDYKAAGLIFKSMLAGHISSTTAQWAIWGLFSTNAANSSYFTKNSFGAVDSTYLGLAGTASNSAFNGLILYTPNNASPGVGPQEFIGYSAVPEPSGLMLMGTGLLGMAGALRRKFAKG